jgi:PiT family inorganic phosphate transporter
VEPDHVVARLPSSSSHALIGGLIGAMLAQTGRRACNWHGLVHKVIIPGPDRPALAFGRGVPAPARDLLGPSACSRRASRIARSASASSAPATWMAFTHGANDAQKTMGVIALALYAEGQIDTFYIPTWVKVSAGARDRLRARTRAAGGSCGRSVSASTRWIPPAASRRSSPRAAVIYGSTAYGYPLSTTHVISGAVMGAGATKRLSAVRWGVAGSMVVA